MDRLALDDPAMTAEIGREVGHHFMEGHYHKLPIESFPMDKMREALEFMKTGKHVGKVRYAPIHVHVTLGSIIHDDDELISSPPPPPPNNHNRSC